MSKLKVVIPARYASTRLPGKPLVDLLGVPMVLRVVQRVQAALPTADVWVATDDQRIYDVVHEASCQVAMTRTDHASGTDRTAELASSLAWPDDSIIINVQGDEPLIEPLLLQQFAQFCAAQAAFTMASVMMDMAQQKEVHNPNVVKLVTDANGHALYFSRSAIPFVRDMPADQWPLGSFYRHVGIYAYRLCELKRLSTTPPCALEQSEKLEQLRALYLGIPIAMMHWQGALHGGIDSPEDVTRVQAILSNGLG
ncbi:MAG: 3-deoxy-manno-octulosonate cytidylyltransferase [Gammaproteobacteria bacterium]|nr:3-deoxy-manno-octulosonate cytidylyltransferase [Gammaproteobacteria bacterium]